MTITRAAEAPFVSTLQPSHRPSIEQAQAAIRDSARRHGGARRCAARCAAEYGEHPETSPARMRWALALAERIRRPIGLTA